MRKLALVVALLSLAACGTNPVDRGLSGAAIGAGTGAAVGAVAGGATGALTSPSAVDLGRPAWR